MDCLLLYNRKQNGNNRNQWNIISNQLLFKQLNLYGFKVGRGRICFALFKIYIQDQKRCIEKVRRISKINFYIPTAREMKKNVMVGFPKTKTTFRNSTTDQDKGIILACLNLIGVLLGSFALGFLFMVFNGLFIRKWLKN